MILQPVSSIFPCSPLPSVTWQSPGLSIPWCCLPISSSVCLVFSPFHCALQDEFGQTWWMGDRSILLQFTSLYNCQRSSCGPIACQILAWTSSLITWSLYQKCSILQYNLISMAHILLCSSTLRVHDSQAYRMWQRSTSIISWNWEKHSCRSKLVSALSAF